MKQDRFKDWLKQAENDLSWGEATLERDFFAQTCFIAQQVAEKALKALAFFRGAESVKSHSVFVIAKALSVNVEIAKAAGMLDQYYLPTRYPDSLPGGVPGEMFSKEQARDALDLAKMILSKVQLELNGK